MKKILKRKKQKKKRKKQKKRKRMNCDSINMKF